VKKIAYLILAHNDQEHLFRLVNVLRFHGDIYIHVDKKSNIDSFIKLDVYENVYFVKNRVSVTWSGISMIDAQNELINQMLQCKEKYGRCVFLSGSCYPIKNLNEVTRYFCNAEKQLIKYIDMRESPDHYLGQVKKKWFREPFLNQKYKINYYLNKLILKLLNSLSLKNDWNSEFIPYFGSQWISLTTECCEYIMDFQDKNPWYRQMNVYTFSPDEHYYHTIIGNSEYKYSSVGLCDYEGRGTYRLANFHVIDSTLSKWFDVDDWFDLINSDKYFVRKVSSSNSKELLNKIDQLILFTRTQ
jgi:hypothetical protein